MDVGEIGSTVIPGCKARAAVVGAFCLICTEDSESDYRYYSSGNLPADWKARPWRKSVGMRDGGEKRVLDERVVPATRQMEASRSRQICVDQWIVVMMLIIVLKVRTGPSSAGDGEAL